MAKAFLVLRISGQADVPYWADTTMTLLKLEKKYRATIIPEKENTVGMLRKIQHYISWQEIDTETVKELLDKKARNLAIKKSQMKILLQLDLHQLMNWLHLWPKEKLHYQN